MDKETVLGMSVGASATGLLLGGVGGCVSGVSRHPIPEVRYEEPNESAEVIARRQLEADPNYSGMTPIQAVDRYEQLKAEELARRIAAEAAANKPAMEAGDRINKEITTGATIGGLGGATIPPVAFGVGYAANALAERRRRKMEEKERKEQGEGQGRGA